MRLFIMTFFDYHDILYHDSLIRLSLIFMTLPLMSIVTSYQLLHNNFTSSTYFMLALRLSLPLSPTLAFPYNWNIC